MGNSTRRAAGCAAPALLAAVLAAVLAVGAAAPSLAQQAPSLAQETPPLARQPPIARQPTFRPGALRLQILVPDENDPDEADEAGPRAVDGLVDSPDDGPSEEIEEQLDAVLRPTVGPYDALGVRVGSFLVFPQIETGVVHSDNIFLSARDRRSDHAATVAPGLSFRSTWSRHEVSGEARMLRSYYERFESENDRQHDVTLRGRLDVTRRTAIEAEGFHGLTQESRDSSDFPQDALERADVRTERAHLQGSHTINRLTFRLRGRVTGETYSDVALDDGGVALNSARDNTLYDTETRVSYEFRPGVSAFAETGVNRRRFRRSIDPDGIRRGSEGWMAQGGLAVALSSKLEGEASIGYARQTPDSGDLVPISGVIVNAGLTWRPTALTTVRFAAESEVHETTFSNSAGSLIRTYEVGVEHALRRNVILGAGLAFGTETFADSGEVSRDWAARLSAEYLLNRHVGIKGEFTHSEELESNVSDGYVENRVRVGVTVRR